MGWQYYAARYDLDSSIDDENMLSRVDLYLRSLENTRPHWSKTRELAGRIALRRGDVPVAIRALEDAVKTPLANPQVYELLLRLYLTDGNYQAIWRLLDRWMQSPPLSRQLVAGNWPRVQRKLDVCRALAALGVDPGDSLDELVFLHGSTGTSGDMIWLRMLLLKNGDSQRAGELLEHFFRQNPHDVAAWMIQLKQDMDSHDGPQAKKTLARIQSLDMPPTELKPFVLGQAFQLAGLWNESQQAYRKVDVKSPFRLPAEIYIKAVEIRIDSRGHNVHGAEHGNSLHGHSSNSTPQQP